MKNRKYILLSISSLLLVGCGSGAEYKEEIKYFDSHEKYETIKVEFVCSAAIARQVDYNLGEIIYIPTIWTKLSEIAQLDPPNIEIIKKVHNSPDDLTRDITQKELSSNSFAAREAVNRKFYELCIEKS